MKLSTPPQESVASPAARRGRKRRPAKERFHDLVERHDGSCHLWLGARPRGYGLFRLSGIKLVGAHRFAYELVFGAIPPGMQIDHVCRVRRCVNPDHLQIVTPEQNMLLHQIRMGNKHIYVWEEALLQGLAVELADLERFRKGEFFPWGVADRPRLTFEPNNLSVHHDFNGKTLEPAAS